MEDNKVKKPKMRVPIKVKIFGLVAFLILSALLIIVLRTNEIFRGDKEAFVKELSAKLAGAVTTSLHSRLATLQDKLLIFISNRESLARTASKKEDQTSVLFQRYPEFLAIGIMKPDNTGKYIVDWADRNPTTDATKWLPGYETEIMNKLDVQKGDKDGRAIWAVQAFDNKNYVFFGFKVQVVSVIHQAEPVKKPKKKKGKHALPEPPELPAKTETVNAWVVGMMPSTVFDNALGDFSTGVNTGYIVDSSGIAIASSQASSQWKNLLKEPIVKDVVQKNNPAGTGEFLDGSGKKIIGSYQIVPQTMLAAIVTTPRDKAFEAANRMMVSIFFIGGVILLFALFTAVLISNYITAPLQRLASIAAEIGAGNFKVDVDVVTNDEIGDLAGSFSKMEKDLIQRDDALASAQQALVQSEKMGAFGQISAGIAHEVKNPLAGILGHAQLAINKISDPDIKKHLEVIEKETRRCKAIVESLMKFARQEKADLQPTDLAQAVQDTINLVDHQLSLAGCKILKDFHPCPMVMANSNQLQQVLLNLMVNSSHAMENRPVKNVTVRVVKANDKTAQIQIEDTGSGIPPDIQKKIFEPFFTTKPAGKGTGLGLSVSIGIVKEHKGEIYLKSEMGKGTTFFIDIPIPDGAKMPDKAIENTHGGIDLNKKAATATPAPTPAPAKPAAPVAPPAPVAKTEKADELPRPKLELAKQGPPPVPGQEDEEGTVTKVFPVDEKKPADDAGEFKVTIKRPKLKV